MAQESDDYLGFRTRAHETEELHHKILEGLASEETRWEEARKHYVLRYKSEQEFFKKLQLHYESAPTSDAKLRAQHDMVQVQQYIEAMILGFAVATLGTQQSQTHQRLADVEKELQALRAALK